MVVDSGNSRVSEFTPWGSFVKAFGFDVAPGAVNEQQEVRVRAATGQFKLSFDGSTTTDLPFDASAAEVEAALSALPSIGAGNASVETVPGAPGITPYVHVVAFKGPLAGTDVKELVAADGTTPLGGGLPSTSLLARTRADGTPGGTGLESCTEESGCRAGVSGAAAGQFNDARSIAVDGAGNLYVREIGNQRVQKFDSAGRFVWVVGGGVNKTTGASLCTAASGDVCDGPGANGSGPGEFANSTTTEGIAACPPGALCPSGAIFVPDVERIQRFSLDGVYEGELSIPGETIVSLAFDPVGEDLYAAFLGKGGIRELDGSTGVEIGAARVGSRQIATNAAGDLFTTSEFRLVLEYDAAGNPIGSCCEAEPGALNGLGTNGAGDLHVATIEATETFIRVLGPAPVIFEGPPPVPPTISAQYATSVERTGAVVGADIDPHFFNDTRFWVEYGTGKCSEGGCEEAKPLPPGALLTGKQVDGALKSPGVFLEGLKPATTYRYRFVAKSGGGGPVRGIGGEVGADGAESSFTTYPAAAPFKADCPNQGFRTGPSAPLPDCRAYEMVSPIDKNNGDIKALPDLPGYDTTLHQSATDGESFTYSSYRAFADPQSGAFTMQYLAKRKAAGWSSEALNPPHAHANASDLGADLDAAFRAFSPDLCGGWLTVAAEPPLAPRAPPGYRTLYRRENCGAAGYEALTAAQPSVEPSSFNAEFQGASADGTRAIFRVRDKLTEEAASGAWQAYHASGEELRLICVLPDGTPSGANCSGGRGRGSTVQELGRLSSLANAISADGSRAYWTDSGANETGPGKVYLRLNPGEEQSAVSGGACSEAEKACTVEVSETASTKAAEFLGASSDGSKALFEVIEGVQAGSLYRFDAETGDSTLIAKKVRQPGEGESFHPGLLGASEDLSRVYFVSEEALPETTGATAGKANLYLDEEGAKTFIATLAEEDVQPEGIFSNIATPPIYRVARVSPDGSHLAFFSTASLSGYDNTDQLTGRADAEVYLYGAGSAGPLCVSCNPSGARPLGRVAKIQSNTPRSLAVAAMLPRPRFSLQPPRPLSADGRHLFFTAYDALLPRDTNGKADVYQWQAAASEEDCEQMGAELYVPGSGGCLSLISTGQSPQDSELLDASADGDDVFFATNASLLAQDPGLIDIYDARAGGGLPPPPSPPGPCQGEACQIAPPPPDDPSPASASFRGQGNPSAKPPRRRCAKGKARRRGRCVAKRRAKRSAGHNRRQSR